MPAIDLQPLHDLVAKWSNEASAGFESAMKHRLNGMFETAATYRAKARARLAAAEELAAVIRTLTPPTAVDDGKDQSPVALAQRLLDRPLDPEPGRPSPQAAQTSASAQNVDRYVQLWGDINPGSSTSGSPSDTIPPATHPQASALQTPSAEGTAQQSPDLSMPFGKAGAAAHPQDAPTTILAGGAHHLGSHDASSTAVGSSHPSPQPTRSPASSSNAGLW